MTPYTGPLAAPIRSTIQAFAKQRGLPCTVAMTYTPGAVPMCIEVDWKELGEPLVVYETDDVKTMTDAKIVETVVEQIERMLHPPKVKRFKERRR